MFLRKVCTQFFVAKCSKSNNNDNNNVHLYSAFLLVIQSALQSVLIVINLIKYYNDLFVKNKNR